jgi:hypothetical protein
MSALPPKTDIDARRLDVGFVPIRDIPRFFERHECGVCGAQQSVKPLPLRGDGELCWMHSQADLLELQIAHELFTKQSGVKLSRIIRREISPCRTREASNRQALVVSSKALRPPNVIPDA